MSVPMTSSDLEKRNARGQIISGGSNTNTNAIKVHSHMQVIGHPITLVPFDLERPYLAR